MANTQTRGTSHILYQRYSMVGIVGTAFMAESVPLIIRVAHMQVSWPVIGVVIGTAVAVMIVMALLLRRGTLVRRGIGQMVLYLWSLLDIGMVGAIVAATGGERSWFWVLFVFTTIFFSIGYPVRVQLVLFGATLVSFLASAAASSDFTVPSLAWKLATLATVFGLASFPASELRRETAEHERARAQADRLATTLAVREAWWRSLIEHTSDPIVVFDDTWRIEFASPAFEAMLGYTPDEFESMGMASFVHTDDLDALRFLAARARTGSSPARTTCRLRTTDGTWRDVEITFAKIVGSERSNVVASLHDVTERVAAEAALSHQATHDSLTALSNRFAFYEALRTCVSVAGRNENQLSVLVLDLENFKEVNDTFGHSVGDELLVEVAHRLTSTLRGADVIARLGGDEFAAVLATGGDPEGAAAAAQRLIRALDSPVVLSSQPYWLHTSIGVACFPAHAVEAEELVQRADRAMYEAKRAGIEVAFYDPEIDGASTIQVGFLGELRRGIDDNELRLYFQPKVSLPSQEVNAVEALVRWSHPRLGLLAPSAFLPGAEASGLVRSLTAWVIPTALRQVRSWMAEGLDLAVAVNLSAKDLAEEDLDHQVDRWLAEAGVPANRLILELTEASAINDYERGSGALAKLRHQGVRVSLDDFGSGFSSLAYLAQLPLDEVKLDRGFLVASLGGDGFLLRSIVEIGHHLGLTVVAEGVETQEACDELADLGCDAVQGFICTEPLPAEDIVPFLERRTRQGSVQQSASESLA